MWNLVTSPLWFEGKRGGYSALYCWPAVGTSISSLESRFVHFSARVVWPQGIGVSQQRMCSEREQNPSHHPTRGVMRCEPTWYSCSGQLVKHTVAW